MKLTIENLAWRIARLQGGHAASIVTDHRAIQELCNIVDGLIELELQRLRPVPIPPELEAELAEIAADDCRGASQ